MNIYLETILWIVTSIPFIIGVIMTIKGDKPINILIGTFVSGAVFVICLALLTVVIGLTQMHTGKYGKEFDKNSFVIERCENSATIYVKKSDGTEYLPIRINTVRQMKALDTGKFSIREKEYTDAIRGLTYGSPAFIEIQ